MINNYGITKIKNKISVQDYLKGEKISEVRHEYIDGEIFARVDDNKNHNLIIGNLIGKFTNHLRKTDFEIYFCAVKVCIEKLNRFYYPDLIVVCGEDSESEYYTKKPTLIIEVLSPGTALTDRREKMFVYRETESLEEYIMIEQDRIYGGIYRRSDDGFWSWIEFEAGEEIEFASIDFRMPMSEIYEGVELPEKKSF